MKDKICSKIMIILKETLDRGMQQRGEGQRKVDKEIAHLRHLPVCCSNLPLSQGYSNSFVVKKSDPINPS